MIDIVQILYSVDEKWKHVRLSSRQSSDSQAFGAVRIPGGRTMTQLQIGGTVSSTSSVHPTKETWLNIQNSSQTSSNNTTERPTMSDLQDMFTPRHQIVSNEGTSSNNVVPEEPEVMISSDSIVNQGVYVTRLSVEKSTDSSA